MKKVIRVVAAVLERDGRYLITQRRDSAVLPLQWGIPPAERSRLAKTMKMRSAAS